MTQSETFLDMLIINTNGKLASRWYRKPTDTGLTLNFHALAPLKYKKSVVISLVRRIYRSSSTWFYFHEGLEEARTILENNQYPPSFVDDIFNVTLTKLIDVNDESNVIDSDSESSELDCSLESNACIQQIANHEKLKFFQIVIVDDNAKLYV